MAKSRFATYLLQPQNQDQIRKNADHGDISRLFDEIGAFNESEGSEFPLFAQLLENAPFYWEHQRWDEWRELALAIATEDLFNDNHNLREEVIAALNVSEDRLRQPMVKKLKDMNIPVDERADYINHALLKGYYATFIFGALQKLINEKKIDEDAMRVFYDAMKKKYESKLPEDPGDSDIFLKWVNDIGITLWDISAVMFHHKVSLTPGEIKSQLENKKNYLSGDFAREQEEPFFVDYENAEPEPAFQASANSRLIEESFYTENRELIFSATALQGVSNEFFHDDKVLTAELIVPTPTPPDGNDGVSSLILDVNRQVRCQGERCSHSTDNMTNENIQKIASFIKKTLDIDEHTYGELARHYSQHPAYFVNNPIALCFENSGSTLIFQKEHASNLFKSDENIYLEVVLTNLTILDDSLDKLGVIPGKIAYQFLLTNDGFKLEKFATDSDVLFDLTIQNSIDNLDEKLKRALGIRPEKSEYLASTPLVVASQTKSITHPDEKLKEALGIRPEEDDSLVAIPLEVVPQTKGFFAKNWPYFAIGLGLAIAVAGVVALGILTFGIGPAIVAGVAATLKALEVVGIALVLTEAVALVVGSASLIVGAVAAYAALFGIAVGVTKTVETLTSSSTKKMHEAGVKKTESHLSDDLHTSQPAQKPTKEASTVTVDAKSSPKRSSEKEDDAPRNQPF